MGRSASADEKKNIPIAQAFGRGHARSSVVSSASLAVLCLFYVYTAASYIELTVYPLQDRITYIATFSRYITTSEYADRVVIGSLLIVWLLSAHALRKEKNSRVKYTAVIAGFGTLYAAATVINYQPGIEGIALASLPAILLLHIYNRYSHRTILSPTSSQLTLNHLAIVGTIIGVIGLVLALAPLFSATTTGPTQETPIIHNYGYDVLLVLSSAFAPALLLLLIACVPVKLLTDRILKGLNLHHVFSDLHSLHPFPHSHNSPQHHNHQNEFFLNRNYRILFLPLIALLSILVVLIPHLPTINPDGQQIGVDTGYYVTWVRNLQSSSSTNGGSDLLYQAFVVQNQGDRPLFLLFLYGLDLVSPATSLFVTVEYVPLILAPALVLATFFLTRELTSHDIASLFAAFITAVSFQTLIGVYAGFYANWMALILGYLSLLFLFRFLKRRKREEREQGRGKRGITTLILFGSLMLLVLFTHVYTWSVLSIAAGILLLVGIIRPHSALLRTERKTAALLMAALLSVVAIDILRTQLIGSSGGVEGDLELAGSLVGPEQFGWRWYNLTYTTTTFVGGAFANFLVLGLGLYWLVRTRAQSTATAFIIIFLSLGILPFIVGEWVVQTRVFYNIPFQIPAGMALALIAQQDKGKEGGGGGAASGLLRVLPIVLLMVLAAIITASNFYFAANVPTPEEPIEIPLG